MATRKLAKAAKRVQSRKTPVRKAEGGVIDTVLKKAKAAGDYVNDNINPLTSKSSQAKAKAMIDKGRNEATMFGNPVGGNNRKRAIDKASGN